jgi:leucyl-tRNA synthetase
MKQYNPGEVEKKWQRRWMDTNASVIDKNDDMKDKFYILDMFPYPSGTGLHMGHTESYTASDVIYRYKKLQGFNVLHPQGFDAFGLPAENYAIKTGIHPAETTKENIANYIRQMQSLGFAYDFDQQAVTSDPEYYRWTQWIFGEFYKNGLVYKKTTKTNWCASCQTVIANEQVVDGDCDRCGTLIEQREVPSWFFKITDFAEELIAGLDKVDWPEYTKKNQRNWIGKSEGAEVDFRIADSEEKITVFTTRIDTLFSGTFLIFAPEHPLVEKITTLTQKEDVNVYVSASRLKTELERIENKGKTGVFTGAYAINPATEERIQIWIADFVLAGYGTGAVFADAHDERDFEMAKKYNIPLKVSIRPKEVDVWSRVEKLEECFSEDGSLVNSGKFDGLTSSEARPKIINWLAEKGMARRTVNYRLRDWSISRQRYWGCPIPIVYSPEGEAHLVPAEHLPWTLPTDVDFVPTGVSPLAKSAELKKRVEDIFGAGWTAEYDTMDTFVDSSWYFLRYPDAHNNEVFCSPARLAKWLPVDVYIGGAEHTYMHLLFARFFTKAMHRLGLVDFDEPFMKLRHQGMVLDKEGNKMSKSKGNVINPDDMVARFGADAVRTYMLFVAPLEDAVMWNEDNVVGIKRFLDKVWKLFTEKELADCGGGCEGVPKELPIMLHKTIKKVTGDMENFAFNTAISQMMIFVNEFSKHDKLPKAGMEKFLVLLAPFAPHITEEIWSEFLGHQESIFLQEWPKFKESMTKDEEVMMVVQVNGKVRDMLTVSADIAEEEAKKLALGSEKIAKYIEGKEIRKIIFVAGKLLNIVV